jgi:hypothetical protein
MLYLLAALRRDYTSSEHMEMFPGLDLYEIGNLNSVSRHIPLTVELSGVGCRGVNR